MRTQKRYLDYTTGSNAVRQYKEKMGNKEEIILCLFFTIAIMIVFLIITN